MKTEDTQVRHITPRCATLHLSTVQKKKCGTGWKNTAYYCAYVNAMLNETSNKTVARLADISKSIPNKGVDGPATNAWYQKR
jgi:hypothetical protein